MGRRWYQRDVLSDNVRPRPPAATHILSLPLPQPPNRYLFQPAHEPGIMAVDFIRGFLAREVDLRGVCHRDVVAGVHCRGRRSDGVEMGVCEREGRKESKARKERKRVRKRTREFDLIVVNSISKGGKTRISPKVHLSFLVHGRDVLPPRTSSESTCLQDRTSVYVCPSIRMLSDWPIDLASSLMRLPGAIDE